MGLEDFNKIENVENDNDVKETDEFDITLNCKNVEYYVNNIDELIALVREYYNKYIEQKLKYEIKKDKYQVTINWTEENVLRESNGLSKVTNKEQREAVINLKVRKNYEKMKLYEMKYKFYNKLFDFISKNYTLLCEYFSDDEI